MYLDRTITKDKEMVESWKGDADNILVFVGLSFTSYTAADNVLFLDWCILCYGCSIACIVCPEYCAEPAEHLSLLSSTYLPTAFYPTEWLPTFYSVELV